MPDPKYHDHREAQERVAAGAATNPMARILHRELADRHATMAALIRRNTNLHGARYAAQA